MKEESTPTMTASTENGPAPGPTAAKPDTPLFGFLASLKFALPVIVLIALACIAGTVIPQGSQVDPFLARHPDWHRTMHVLAALGLTRVFYAWWFILLLFVLAASLTLCTLRRYAAIGRTTGAVRARVIGSFVTHVSLLLVIAGGVVRVFWAQKGTIQFHEGETVAEVVGADGTFPLPFAIRLAKFDLEFYKPPAPPPDAKPGKLVVQWAGKAATLDLPVEPGTAYPVAEPEAPAGSAAAYTVRVLRYLPDFSLDGPRGEAKSRSDQPNNPAVQVEVSGAGKTNTQWVFAKFPDFNSHGGEAGAMPLSFRFESTAPAMTEMPSIKAFKSTVEVLENKAVVQSRVIAVNSPFSYGGFTFYQLSYDPRDLTWSALQVVKDPSVPIVYGGFILMMIGLSIVFCVGPWLETQHRTTGG